MPKYGIEGPVYLTPPPGRGKAKGNNKAAPAQGEEQMFVLDEETQSVVSR